jgi:sugar phosphate isomerase/epimerase
MGIGGRRDRWGSIRAPLVEILRDCAALAEEEDVVLAAEAHCGAAVYDSDRAIWLFETVNSPRVRMHFDIVHMFLAGEREEEAVKALVPYTPTQYHRRPPPWGWVVRAPAGEELTRWPARGRE